jgi:hypothetical protein
MTYAQRIGQDLAFVGSGVFQNFGIEQLAVDPSPITKVSVWYNTTSNTLNFSSINTSGAFVINQVSDVASAVSALSAETAAREADVATLTAKLNQAINGLSWKYAVEVMLDGTDTAVALTGLYTIQGYAIQEGDRIAVNVDTPAGWQGNGIYIATAAGAWSRSTDMNETTPLDEFTDATFYVENGTYGGKPYTQVNQVNVVGTDAVAFTQSNGANSLDQGYGIVIVGNTIAVVGDNSTIIVDSTGVHVAQAYTDGINSTISSAVSNEQTQRTLAIQGLQTQINTADGNISALLTSVGDSSTLQTTAKNLSGAINEVLGNINSLSSTVTGNIQTAINGIETQIGTVASLTTTANNLVGAINEVKASVATLSTSVSGDLQTAIDNVQSGLTQEIQDRGTAITNLSNTLAQDIAAEAAARDADINGLVSAINSQRYNYASTVAASSYTVNHNLNTGNIQVTIRGDMGNGVFDNILLPWHVVDANNIYIGDIGSAMNVIVSITANDPITVTP